MLPSDLTRDAVTTPLLVVGLPLAALVALRSTWSPSVQRGSLLLDERAGVVVQQPKGV